MVEITTSNKEVDQCKNEAIPPQIPEETEVFVTDPGPDDILLGRGAPFLSYQGNKRFRAIVKTMRSKYKDALKNQMKNIIAREVHDAVTENGGRFLMQVQTTSGGASGGDQGAPDTASTTTRLWKVAPKTVSLEKCKQALRDSDPQSRLKQKKSVMAGIPRNSTVSQGSNLLFGLANAAAMHEAFRQTTNPGEDSSLTGSSASSSTFCTPIPSPCPSPTTHVPNQNLLLALSLSNFQRSLASQTPVAPQGFPPMSAQPPAGQLPILPPLLIEALKQAQQQQMQAAQMQLVGKLLLLNGLQVEQNQNMQTVLDLLKGAVGKEANQTAPLPVANADVWKALALLQNQKK